MPLAHCKRLRRLDEAARPFGIFFNIHQGFPRPAETTPFGNGYAIFIGFPLIALTFVNRRPAVVPPMLGRLRWANSPRWVIVSPSTIAHALRRKHWHPMAHKWRNGLPMLATA